MKVYFPNDLEAMGFHHTPLDLKTSCPFEEDHNAWQDMELY